MIICTKDERKKMTLANQVFRHQSYAYNYDNLEFIRGEKLILTPKNKIEFQELSNISTYIFYLVYNYYNHNYDELSKDILNEINYAKGLNSLPQYCSILFYSLIKYNDVFNGNENLSYYQGYIKFPATSILMSNEENRHLSYYSFCKYKNYLFDFNIYDHRAITPEQTNHFTFGKPQFFIHYFGWLENEKTIANYTNEVAAFLGVNMLSNDYDERMQIFLKKHKEFKDIINESVNKNK